ncbi:MAG: hypothetical protein WBP79_04400, partial [Candidatus Acidiferrales bacterium]
NANGSFSTCATGGPTLGSGALAGVGPFFEGALGTGLQTLSAGLLDYNNGVANAVYHGLTISVIEKWGKLFNLNANYTYSHVIDNGNFTTFINLPPNQFDYAAERSNSNQDVRHHFVTNFTVTPPESSFLRHFTLSSIITLQSGRPFTLFYGANTLNDIAGGATDRVAAPLSGDCPTASNCTTMVSRNTYTGDPFYSWDFHLSRLIHISERMKLDLSFDAFNLLNRPNVDEVTSIYGSPVFCGGGIPRHYNDAMSRAIQAGAASTACPNGGINVPGGSIAPTPIAADFPESSGAFLFIPSNPNPNFGLPRTMLNPRQLQFAVKFIF